MLICLSNTRRLRDGAVHEAFVFWTGYCLAVVDAICRDRKRMDDILLFASYAEAGDILWKNASHRSVGASMLCKMFFGRVVDFTHVAPDNCSCGRRAVDHKDELNIALCSLRRDSV